MGARRARTWHSIPIPGVAAVLVLAGPVGQADAVVTGLARVTPFTSSTSAAQEPDRDLPGRHAGDRPRRRHHARQRQRDAQPDPARRLTDIGDAA